VNTKKPFIPQNERREKMKRILVVLLVSLIASVASATVVWDGSDSSNWADGNNWSANPSSTERRNIPSNGTNAPIVSSNSTAGVVHQGRNDVSPYTVLSSTLTVSGGTLTVTSGGTELVSVAYTTGLTNNLTVNGGNLVVYRGDGTGEIRLQHTTGATCVGNVNLVSGSIDVERLNLGTRDGLGTFTGSGGTLTVRSRIDRFGLVGTNASYGFRLGGTTLEMASITDRTVTGVIGNVSVGAGVDTDFIMQSASKIVFDLGDPDGAAGTNWDLLTANGNFTLAGELVVDFGTYDPEVGDKWKVIVVNAGDVLTYSGYGMFETLPSNIQAALVDGGDSLELTYVPEPATMVLLAVGGLIAARRRK